MEIDQEALMVMKVNQFAEDHNVKVGYDFENHIINFDGEVDNELALAERIGEEFGGL